MAAAHRHRVVVIGGANTDIVGVSDAPLVPRDSNPGAAVVSAGGVARNVAENLTRLGVETHLLTAFGGDHDGRALAEDCRALGIDVSAALHDAEAPGSRYIAIMDADGDLALALNDMRAMERVMPAVLEERRGLLDSADLLVADCNLPPSSLEWLAEHARAPLVVDPVSVAKAPRVRGALDGVHTLKANALEVAVLAGVAVASEDDVGPAADALVDQGVERVFATLGEGGAYCARAGMGLAVGAPSVRVVNATGAGDAFTAGVAYATLEGRDLGDTARFATAMAVLTLESERSVSERVEAELVELMAKELAL